MITELWELFVGGATWVLYAGAFLLGVVLAFIVAAALWALLVFLFKLVMAAVSDLSYAYYQRKLRKRSENKAN